HDRDHGRHRGRRDLCPLPADLQPRAGDERRSQVAALPTMTSQANPSYRMSLRLYVVFSLLMAAAAAASGLFMLYLARPFAAELSGPQPRQLTVLLFTGSGAAGALAAIGAL